MHTIWAILLGILIGISISALYRFVRRRSPRIADHVDEQVPAPLPPEEYTDRLERIRERYHDAMAQYDRLVPWAAGGGLVVSLGFVPSIAPTAQEWARWILGTAWAALGFSLLCSIISQYTSTRISAWFKEHLVTCQSPPADSAGQAEKDEWRTKVLNSKYRSDRNGLYTKWLNVSAGLLLVTGLIALGVFAVMAAPFGSDLPIP